jgi:hypothetical protein
MALVNVVPYLMGVDQTELTVRAEGRSDR